MGFFLLAKDDIVFVVCQRGVRKMHSRVLLKKTCILCRNRMGGVGAELIALLLRLSSPPRRWKVRGGLVPLMDLETVVHTFG